MTLPPKIHFFPFATIWLTPHNTELVIRSYIYIIYILYIILLYYIILYYIIYYVLYYIIYIIILYIYVGRS
jgi:hypothetical protein